LKKDLEGKSHPHCQIIFMENKNTIKDHIKWEAPEFEHFSKDKSWSFASGLIALAVLIWAVWTKNFLLAILICVGYFTFVAYAYKKPRKINFAVTPQGVQIDKTLYDYDNLRSFWIYYQPPQIKELSLRSRKKLMPYIKIPLGRQNPADIRAALIQYIPEKRHKESLVDDLSRAIRF